MNILLPRIKFHYTWENILWGDWLQTSRTQLHKHWSVYNKRTRIPAQKHWPCTKTIRWCSCFHQKDNLMPSKVERYYSSTVFTLEKYFFEEKTRRPEFSVLQWKFIHRMNFHCFQRFRLSSAVVENNCCLEGHCSLDCRGLIYIEMELALKGNKRWIFEEKPLYRENKRKIYRETSRLNQCPKLWVTHSGFSTSHQSSIWSNTTELSCCHKT